MPFCGQSLAEAYKQCLVHQPNSLAFMTRFTLYAYYTQNYINATLHNKARHQYKDHIHAGWLQSRQQT